jgi:hypothetical protein
MRTIFFTLLLVLFINQVSVAQSTRKPIIEIPSVNIRTGLTSLLDYDAGLMLGVNYRWSKHFSATLEPTWIFYNALHLNDDGIVSPAGFKIRADVRYHFPRETRRDPDFFLAPELHYKSVNTEREDEFGINCIGGNCDYYQQAVYTEKKKEIGGFVKAGILTPLSFLDKSNRLNIEAYFGVGIKRLTYTETDLPVGGSFVNPPVRDIFNVEESAERNKVLRPMVPIGVKLCFIL